jgi:hypothetical protein
MEDKRKFNGGHSTAPKSSSDLRLQTKAEEEKTNYYILTAIKEIKSVTTDAEARIEVIKELFTFDRGKIFIAEHLLGKPKETVDQNVNINNFELKDIIKFKE